MAIIIPAPLAALFGGLTGMPWPEINEDNLRLVAAEYEQMAAELPRLKQHIHQLGGHVREQFEGYAAAAFASSLDALLGGGDDYLGQAAQQAAKLSEVAFDVARQAEYAKWMTIAQLVQLEFDIATAIAMAPWTGGASLLNISWMYFFTREALLQILRFLLRSILVHTFISVAYSYVTDFVVQTIQVMTHRAKDYDREATEQALKFGVISGVLSGGMELFGMGLGRLIGRIFGKSGGAVVGKELGRKFTKAVPGGTGKAATEAGLKNSGNAVARAGATGAGHQASGAGAGKAAGKAASGLGAGAGAAAPSPE
ncbi:hypothetical protein, partial [Streptomyces sp. WAC06614]|uniref:WXG100-like domain-containing protein n=1 Tax=Streptomyces sp. WAC06614 TaxID=2487416 RepID=UPI000FC24EAD